MKKMILLIAILSVSAWESSAASPFASPLPPQVRNTLRAVENNMKVWTVAKVEPLSQTLRSPVAEGSWRIVLERPFETAPVEGLPDPLNKRSMKNNAEIVLVKNSPGSDPQSIRKQILWKVAHNELFTTISYLGVGGGYHYFVKADIVTLDWLKTHLRLIKGDNLGEVIAEALNVEDENNFSRRSAVSIIGNYGDAAIPFVKRALGVAIAEHEEFAHHFRALKNIGTPRAAQELKNAFRTGNSDVQVAVMDALSAPPYLKEARELYFTMVERHYYIASAIEAAVQFKWEKEMLPYLQRASHRPISFAEYAIVMTTIDQFITGNKVNSPELDCVEQIKILLTRSGDIAGSPRILSLSDKATALNVKLNSEDLKRVRPFEDALVKSKNQDMAIVAALALVVYDPGLNGPTPGQGPQILSRDYVRRVRESGMRVLLRLNRTKVRLVLMNLKSSVESEAESNRFSSLAARLSRL